MEYKKIYTRLIICLIKYPEAGCRDCHGRLGYVFVYLSVLALFLIIWEYIPKVNLFYYTGYLQMFPP